MENYIKKVSRNDKMFENRAIKIYKFDNLGVPESVIPVPDNEIICDACNKLIESDFIYLLFINNRIYGTVCDNCKTKYHSTLKVV